MAFGSGRRDDRMSKLRTDFCIVFVGDANVYRPRVTGIDARVAVIEMLDRDRLAIDLELAAGQSVSSLSRPSGGYGQAKSSQTRQWYDSASSRAPFRRHFSGSLVRLISFAILARQARYPKPTRGAALGLRHERTEGARFVAARP